MNCHLLRSRSPQLGTLPPRAYTAPCSQLAVRERPTCLAEELVFRSNPHSKCSLRALQLVTLAVIPNQHKRGISRS